MLERSLDSAKNDLLAFLGFVGRTANPAIAADTLYREAKARYEELQSLWTEARARAAVKKRIEHDLAEARASTETAMIAVEELRRLWPTAMAAVSLPESATTAEAEAALGVWQEVGVPKAAIERESRSFQTMEADIAKFDRDVFETVSRVAPGLQTDSATQSLMLLSQRLTDMRSASESRRQLRAAAAKRALDRDALDTQRKVSAAILEEALLTLGAPDLASVSRSIELLEKRQQLEDEQASLRRELPEIADGRNAGALKEEQKGLDFDGLPGEIDREKMRQSQLLNEITEASVGHRQKEGELKNSYSRSRCCRSSRGKGRSQHRAVVHC